MARDNYIQAAFENVCNNAVKPESWHVCLMERYQVYGGPEEGGWWRDGSNVVAWQTYPTEELARAAEARVLEFAAELSHQAKRSYGDHCLRTMEWLEARGLEADYLPEPDGPSEYYVRVCQEIPSDYLTPAGYE